MKALIDFFKPYYDKNDDGHKIDHALDVMNDALNIKKKLNLDIPDEEIIISSLIHDMFVYAGRKDHHERAYEFVINEVYLEKHRLSAEAQLRIAHAVREHRASYKGSYYSQLSELISSADRGKPDLNKTIERSLIYHSSCGESDPYIAAIRHIKEKYGTSGYARYPKIYHDVYGDLLSNQRLIIDNM